MTNSTQNPHAKQLELFLEVPSTPPLDCAKEFGFRLEYFDVDSRPANYLYHVGQWIAGLTDGQAARNTGTRIKARIAKRVQGGTVTQLEQFKIAKLPFKADNGKVYHVDYASEQYLYMIAQEIPETHQSPQIDTIKDYLSASGALVTWIKNNREEAARRLSRTEGIKARNQFTEQINRSHITNRPNYAYLTNATYHALGLSQKEKTATKEIIKQLQLSPK